MPVSKKIPPSAEYQERRAPDLPDYLGAALQKGYVITDYQGNVRNVLSYDYGTDPVLVNAAWYGPFGKQDSSWIAGNDWPRFTYNDKELDNEASQGLYYYGARFYDPVIGRFTSPDPMLDDWTPYSYVRNNPIKYNDPTGMVGVGGGDGGDVFYAMNESGSAWEAQTRDQFDAWDLEDQGKVEMSRAQQFFYFASAGSYSTDKRVPGGPDELGPDWYKNTKYGNKTGSEWINRKTGEKMEWNPKKEDGKKKWDKKDHWHYTPPGGERSNEHYEPGDLINKDEYGLHEMADGIKRGYNFPVPIRGVPQSVINRQLIIGITAFGIIILGGLVLVVP